VKLEPSSAQIAKVVVCYEKKYMVAGIKFYSEDGACILEVGSFEWGSQKEINLKKGERIVGVKSRLHTNDAANHDSLVFVVGKWE